MHRFNPAGLSMRTIIMEVAMKDIKIAVIDTAIDLNCTHLDLSSIEIDNRFWTEQEDCTYPKGHGTAICGIIQKYAPHVKIVLFPVSSNDDSSVLVNILNYIYERRICKVVNLSLGFFCAGAKTTELRAICKKLYAIGIIIVSAYDNQGLMSYPACFDEVIGVDTTKDIRGEKFIWVEGSPINVICSSEKKRVLWENGNKVYVKGNSFSVPYISSIISEMYCSADSSVNVKSFLKKRADSVQALHSINKKVKSVEVNRAIIFPVNDDTLPIMAFINDCAFNLVGVYDYKYSSKIGKKLSDVCDYTFDIDFDIKSYDDIEWESDFDTIILGKIDDVQSSLQRDIIYQLQFNCKKYGKIIYLLDDNIHEFDNESKTIFSTRSSPMNAYPSTLLGKKWVNSIFKICVAGTGLDVDKLFIQLQLKRIMLSEGYNVGYLATHKSGYLLGADETFTYDKKQFDIINEKDKALILNNLIHEIELENYDIIITGMLSEMIPSNSLSPNPIVFAQGTFLYTLQPNVVILVVSPDDSIKLIIRYIDFVRTIIEGNVVCIAVSPTKILLKNGLTNSKNLSGSKELLFFIERIEKETGIKTVELDEKGIVQIKEACLKHVI